jgi:hypothetical protein
MTTPWECAYYGAGVVVGSLMADGIPWWVRLGVGLVCGLCMYGFGQLREWLGTVR